MKRNQTAGLAGTVIFAGLAGAGHAADLPTLKEPAPPPPAQAPAVDWSGFYIGVQGGYLWGMFDPEPGTYEAVKPSSALGGGQVGYNWQYDRVVFGVEADAAYLDASNTTSFQATTPASEGVVVSDYSWMDKIDAVGTLRGRGGIDFGNMFLYGTGGLAWADLRQQSNALVTNFDYSVTPYATESNSLRVGWSVGVGGEMKFDQHWSVAAQFLHMDFGRPSFDFAGIGSQSFALSLDEATARVNYRF